MSITSKIYNTPNPIGFDFVVSEIQQQISQLNLIEAIFGVAHIQVDMRDNKITEDTYLLQDMGKKGTMKHERWYPQGQGVDGVNIDLTIDDSYISRLFFLAKDMINSNPSQDSWSWSDSTFEFCQTFAIILHFNLQKIKNQMPSITSLEKVKLLIMTALNKCPMLIVKGVSENIDNVWKEFSMTTEINGFSIYPFCAMRFDCDIYFYPLGVNNSQLGK